MLAIWSNHTKVFYSSQKRSVHREISRYPSTRSSVCTLQTVLVTSGHHFGLVGSPGNTNGECSNCDPVFLGQKG